MFNTNIKTNNDSMSVRLRVNKKFNKKSLSSAKDITYSRNQGYVLYVLKKATYEFDLEFKSNSSLTFTTDNKAEAQGAYLNIVLLE